MLVQQQRHGGAVSAALPRSTLLAIQTACTAVPLDVMKEGCDESYSDSKRQRSQFQSD
jgi:hypothetical protein